MPHFFIIDRVRRMDLAEGKDRQDAIEKYNDTHKMKSDHVIQAIPCVHPKKFIAPELPEWMDDIQPAIGSSICHKCSSEIKHESVIIEDAFLESGFYQSKKEL